MLTAESLNRIVSTNESEDVLSARGFYNLLGRNATAHDNNGMGAAGSGNGEEPDEFKYILFVWDGIETSGLTKANALAKAVELETLFSKAKDAVLKVLFSGGVIRGKKLQRGSVYVMSDLIDQHRNGNGNNSATANAMVSSAPSQPIDAQQMATFYERILLLKCLASAPGSLPRSPSQYTSNSAFTNSESSLHKQPFSNLKSLFAGSDNTSSQSSVYETGSSSQNGSYWSRFATVASLDPGLPI